MRRTEKERLFLKRRLAANNGRSRRSTIQITLSGDATTQFLEYLTRRKTPPSPLTTHAPEPRVRPTLRPWVEIIDQIIKDDAGLPKRVRTTAMQILDKLRKEHGYTGCYNVVQEYVRQARNPDIPNIRSRQAETSPKAVTESPIDTPRVVQPAVALSPALPVSREAEAVHLMRGATVVYRQSRRPQRVTEPEEQAIGWMRSVQQGAIPLEILMDELTDIPSHELEILFKAARMEKLSIRNRSMAVMSYVRGITCPQICSFLQISTGSLFRYWKDYREGGTKKLLTRKVRSDKRSNNESVKSAVFALLHSPPAAHGVNRTTWTLAELEKILSKGSYPASAETIRAIIKESGFKWRHARVVLTSNDPDYRAKVEAITKILSELGSDEAFCSIDEYGPFAVKMKGGKKRVAPGEQYIVPQWQKSKGWVILTAALELSRNQVTHFYSRKKDTNEMMRMADTLRSQYRSCRTVYLSWDAASWHVSKQLLAHLEQINKEAAVEGFPIIKTAPLPAGAQFLNVIESVFSGMARAIIHNSDYATVEIAKEVIDRYFADRNTHFAEHPKRAGQKIWGKERVPSVFSEGQNCKDPMYQYLT